MNDNAPASDAYREDLADLADHAFRTAPELCGDCATFHALWGYGRLAGINNGVATDADIFAPVLARLAPRGACILIAGAADAGLPAAVLRATRGSSPRVTVMDRCETPLSVCRRYAQSRGLAIETLKSDLAGDALAGPYDLIVGHYLLRHFPPPLTDALLRNLARSLAGEGRLVLVNRMPLRTRVEVVSRAERDRAALSDALAARGMAPHEMAVHLERMQASLAVAQDRRARSASTLDAGQIEDSLNAAGFIVRERIEHKGRRMIPAGGKADALPIFVAVASLRKPS